MLYCCYWCNRWVKVPDKCRARNSWHEFQTKKSWVISNKIYLSKCMDSIHSDLESLYPKLDHLAAFTGSQCVSQTQNDVNITYWSARSCGKSSTQCYLISLYVWNSSVRVLSISSSQQVFRSTNGAGVPSPLECLANKNKSFCFGVYCLNDVPSTTNQHDHTLSPRLK